MTILTVYITEQWTLRLHLCLLYTVYVQYIAVVFSKGTIAFCVRSPAQTHWTCIAWRAIRSTGKERWTCLWTCTASRPTNRTSCSSRAPIPTRSPSSEYATGATGAWSARLWSATATARSCCGATTASCLSATSGGLATTLATRSPAGGSALVAVTPPGWETWISDLQMAAYLKSMLGQTSVDASCFMIRAPNSSCRPN